MATTLRPRDLHAEVSAIVRDLVRDKGNVVHAWPDDEADAYRQHDGFKEGMRAVEELRAEKGTRALLEILSWSGVADQITTNEGARP